MVRRLWGAVFVFCAFSSSFPLWSQSTAEVRGRVLDPAHHPVVSAFVMLTGRDTSLMRAATTDERGVFSFPSLPVGSYELRVAAQGFPTFLSSRLQASIGRAVTFDIVLGQAQTGPRPGSSLLETGNAQLGVVMEEREVAELPLKSRDAFDLLQLQPGVQSALGEDLFFGGNQPGVVSVSGGRARSNNYNVNGGAAGDVMANYPLAEPSPDSISEFRVITHNYDASLGRNSGSVLNVVTKSGGSGWHGSAFEFLRNNILDAAGYFDPTVPDFKQNDFGATLGGPIQRTRTFSFLSYEGRREVEGISSEPVIVPLAPERAGNFLGPAFGGEIHDATVAQTLKNRPGCAAAVSAHGGAPIAPGTAYAAIFPENVIPQLCFDATAVDLMNQFVPLPNAGGPIFRSTPDARVRNDQITARIDRNLTGQQQLSVYYYGGDGYDLEPFSTFTGEGATLPGFGNITRARYQQWNLSHAWTINAKTINESRFVYLREGQGQLMSPIHTGLVQDSCKALPTNECFSDPSDPAIGIHPGYPPEDEGVPFINVAGGFSFGNNAAGSFSQAANIYHAQDTLTKIEGNHTLKTGFDWRDERLHQLYLFDVSGALTFVGGGANDIGFTDFIPDYLLGLADVYFEGSANTMDMRQMQLAFYGQDTWKIKPNLVLDYGLRWEWNTPQADAGKMMQTFRPGEATAIYPCLLSASDPLVSLAGSADCSPKGAARSVFPLGLLFPGDRGVGAGLTSNYFRSYAPRLGFAWSPSQSEGWLAKVLGAPGRSSVRAGWGIFYDSDELLLVPAQPPFGGTAALENVLLNTPFLGQNGYTYPNPFHGFLDPLPGSPVDFAQFRPITLNGDVPPHLPTQYSEHYNLTVQRELSSTMLLQLGYVGNQGHRLTGTLDQNYGTAQTCLDINRIPGMSCGPLQEDQAFYIPANAIPPGVTLHLPYGSVPSVTGPNASPITLVGLRKYSSPFCQPTTGVGCPPDGVPVFGSLFTTAPLASSSYNSLQALLNKRFSHGLEFLASYTWSKSIDNASSFEEALNPIDPSRSRALSLFDARHRFVFSEVWRVPELNIHSWTRQILNGWSAAGILTLQSGFPIRIISESDLELMGSFDYESPGEPDQIAPLRRLNPEKSGGYFFNPSSFVDGPLGQIGDSPRTVCCGPGIANLDLGIHKDIPIGEGKNLEFRTEIFNVMNHTQFYAPDGDITDGLAFGRVSRTRDPRLIQLALRLTF